MNDLMKAIEDEKKNVQSQREAALATANQAAGALAAFDFVLSKMLPQEIKVEEPKAE